MVVWWTINWLQRRKRNENYNKKQKKRMKKGKIDVSSKLKKFEKISNSDKVKENKREFSGRPRGTLIIGGSKLVSVFFKSRFAR